MHKAQQEPKEQGNAGLQGEHRGEDVRGDQKAADVYSVTMTANSDYRFGTGTPYSQRFLLRMHWSIEGAKHWDTFTGR
jgi:hypothetical protein